MISQTYKDVHRYLQAVDKLKFASEKYFELPSGHTIIPHDGKSFYSDRLPVNSDVLKTITQEKVLYAVTHKSGVMYVQSLRKLRELKAMQVVDNTRFYSMDCFKNLKQVIKNPWKNLFVHLHCHSTYSSVDGMGMPDDIARRCRQLDMPACSITDHGNVAGAIEFYKACKDYGVKPIIGQEFYLDDDRFQKGLSKEDKKKFGKDKEAIKIYEKENRINLRRHLILLAMNDSGLKNIFRLSSLAFLDGFYYRPRIDWELLQKYNEGLIASTACIGGLLGSNESIKQRIENFKKLYKIFGRDRLYLELMLNEFDEQPEVNDFIIKLSKKTKVKTIVTTDAHMVDPDPHHVHRYYMKIGSGFTYGEGENYLKIYPELKNTYHKYFEKHGHKWGDYEKAILETIKVSERCDVEIELGKFKIPKFNLNNAVIKSKSNENNVSYFKRRAFEGFKKWVVPYVKKERIQKYKSRFVHEVKTFIECGYVNYILIVMDIIDYAKSKNDLVVVRGSAAGSLLLYCLEMTSVDPIENNLLFERFVSPLRAGLVDKSYQSPPDIDSDFEDRDKIIEYVASKYGQNSVARIGTCNRSQLKKAIKDMANATGHMDFGEANALTKKISDTAKTWEQALEENSELKDWYKTKRNKEFIDRYVEPIIGLVGQHSIHAAGIVIAPGKITDYIPIKYQEKKKEEEKNQGENRFVVTQFEGDSVESVGLLKFDILRVRTLAHMHITLDLIKQRYGKVFNLRKINLRNPKYYEGFNEKDTQGVFQLDTKATSNLLNHMEVHSFEDLCALIALSRPGTAGPGMDIEYCERKKGKSFEYDHPSLEPILKKTYGICLYQELAMQVFSHIGDLSLVEADRFRKIMKKKDAEKMASYMEMFISGAKRKHNLNREEALKIWKNLESYSSYGFCAAHSAAYAQVSLWTMFFKRKYPLEFYIGWLENPKNKDQHVEIYKDINRHEIPIILPNVNKSKNNFYISDKDEIVWALKGIKYVGEAVATAIAENAPYTSMKDFIEKTKGKKVTKRVIDPLISIGAFPWYDSPNEAATDYYKNIRGEDVPAIFQIKSGKHWNKLFYNYTGFYKVDLNDIYAEELESYGDLDSIDAYKESEIGDAVKIAGLITDFKEHKTKSGNLMAFLNLEVDYEKVDVVIWNSFYASHPISSMIKDDIVGKFAFVFGNRSMNQYNKEQIELSEYQEEDEDILKIFE